MAPVTRPARALAAPEPLPASRGGGSSAGRAAEALLQARGGGSSAGSRGGGSSAGSRGGGPPPAPAPLPRSYDELPQPSNSWTVFQTSSRSARAALRLSTRLLCCVAPLLLRRSATSSAALVRRLLSAKGSGARARSQPATMPYIADFEQFFNEAEKMYLEHPAHVRFAAARHTLRHPPAHARAGKNCASATGALHRQPPHSAHAAERAYVMRYRHCGGKLILKVTDDRVCLKFQTDQQTDVKNGAAQQPLLCAHVRRGPARARARREGGAGEAKVGGRVGEAAGELGGRRARSEKARSRAASARN